MYKSKTPTRKLLELRVYFALFIYLFFFSITSKYLNCQQFDLIISLGKSNLNLFSTVFSLVALTKYKMSLISI